jgi:alkylation response protein AidB-like acyl-CoA dehydrogenase
MEEHVRPRAAEIDARADFPDDVLALFREHGVFRAVAPAAYGGLDGRLLTMVRVCEQITRVCASSGMILGNQYLGTGPITLSASEEQKERWLPGLASGELLCSFGLTEPDAGSDAARLRSVAARDGDGWRISGQKVFITHADIADLLTVFARVDRDDRRSITAFVLEREVSPWEVVGHERKMGLRGSTTCALSLDETWVPDANRVGEVGDGMRIALSGLNKGRIMTGSLALGLATGALELAVEHADHGSQAAQFALAEMDADVAAARALVHDAARRYDAGDADIIRVSALAKLFATDMVNRVTSRAVEVLGEPGLTSTFAAERMFRDARIYAIFEGTNEIQKLVAARELQRGLAEAPA